MAFNFVKDNSIEESKEFTGSAVLPTDVYPAIVEQAYIQARKNQQGDNNLFATLKLKVTKSDGTTQLLTDTFFIAKQTANGLQYWYEKDGKKTEYPAFSALNRHLQNAIGEDLFTTILEEKTLPVYNFQTQKEEPTQVQAISKLFNIEVAAGIYEKHMNKRSDESQLVKTNTIEKLWRKVGDNFLTAKEVEAGVTESNDIRSWKDANKGKVNDRELDKEKLQAGSSTSAKGSTTTPLQIG